MSTPAPVEDAPNPVRRWMLSNLSRNVVVVGVATFFNDISSEMIVPVLPLFLTAVLGTPVAAVGLIEGVAQSTASVLGVFSGWISDRSGRRKPLILVGFGLRNFTKPLLAISNAWPQVLAIRFGDRFGKGIGGAPRDALIADSTEPALRGRAFGFRSAMDAAGSAVGPLIAAAVLAFTDGNPRTVFWIASIPGIAAVAITFWFLREHSAPPRDTAAPRLGFRHLGRPFLIFTAISTLFALGNSSDAFLILRAKNVGMATAVIPLAYFGFNTLYTLLATPAGVLSDRLGRRRLLVTGYVAFAVVYAGFALAQNAPSIAVLFLAYSLFYACTDGVGKALITDLVPSELRATANGTYATATGIALLPASVVAGALWQAVGPWAPFAYGAVLGGVATALLVTVPFNRMATTS